MTTETVQGQAVDENHVLRFLKEAKEANPMTVRFELHTPEWIHDYPDIEQLIAYASEQGLVDAVPSSGIGQDEAGHWYLWTITLRPKLVKILKGQAPGKDVRRQVTIDGKEVDLRNRANFDLVNARIEDVEAVTQSYLHQLRNSPIRGQRRACMCQLHRVMLLRGPELHRDLFSSICLRLGSELPEDFWSLSRVSKVGNLSLYTDRVGRENERNQTYLTHIMREAPNT